jgi:hypothetical protein
MKWPSLPLICFSVALPTSVFAQAQTIERQFKGNLNTDINLGIFTSMRANCTVGPLPVIRLVVPPAHGKITVKQGRVRATNFKQCLGAELPAFVATYRPAKDFIGKDLFTLEVIGLAGKSQIQRIVVIVTKPGAGLGI